MRNKVCGWVPHPQINKNGKKKEGKKMMKRVSKIEKGKIIAFSKGTTNKKQLFLKLCSIIISIFWFQNPQNLKKIGYLCLGPAITCEKSSWFFIACFLKVCEY